MDNALKEMVFKYGFRTVHTALVELADIMRKDAEEFQRISYPLAPRREPAPPPEMIYIPEVKPQTLPLEDGKSKKIQAQRIEEVVKIIEDRIEEMSFKPEIMQLVMNF